MSNGQAYFKNDRLRVHQGDIYTDVVLTIHAYVSGKELIIEERTLPYAVVLTQDCDLLQDYNNKINNAGNSKHDKYLPTLLISPAYPAETFKEGKHLDNQDLIMHRYSTDQFKQITQNNNARCHFLSSNINFNIPELVIDFKHYFTIKRDLFYTEIFQNKYLATVSELFRESLSQRFCNYLSRIGLPDIS